MTGYTVHTGSNDKFREGWDKIFQSRKEAAKSQKKTGKDAGKTGKTKSR